MPGRQSRWSEDLPEQLTRAKITNLRIPLQTIDQYTQRGKCHCQSIDQLNTWCSELQDELQEAQNTIQSL